MDFNKAFESFNFLPMNQTPMTTPPSRQSTTRVANTLTSLWVDTLPDTVLNNNSCYKYLKQQNKKQCD